MARACKLRKVAAARCSRRDAGLAKPEMDLNKWLDLPRDSLSRIFSLLNPIDVILVVPLVCKYWGRIFLEQFFWKQDNGCLDFTPLGEEPFYSFFCRSGNKNSMAIRMMKLLVGAMHSFASDGHSAADDDAYRVTPIIYIKFPLHILLYDRHIVYVAERSPELRRLFMPCATNLTGKGIARAMRYWSNMEQIVYGPFRGPKTTGEILCLIDLHLPRVVVEFGINCKALQCLSLFSFHFQWQSSDLIASNLKSLKILMLQNVIISKCGVQTFLSRCKKVQVLDIRRCVSDIGGPVINLSTCFLITRHQEGRRRRWRTDLYADKVDESYTPKELVKLIWQ